jgi:addiction module HigA family antidote
MSIKRPASGWDYQRVTTHPGEMLDEEFLKPLGLSQNRLALALRVPATRINQIVRGKLGVTPDTALRLGRYFGTGAEFWMNLQSLHDLTKTKMELGKKIEIEVLPRSA